MRVGLLAQPVSGGGIMIEIVSESFIGLIILLSNGVIMSLLWAHQSVRNVLFL